MQAGVRPLISRQATTLVFRAAWVAHLYVAQAQIVIEEAALGEQRHACTTIGEEGPPACQFRVRGILIHAGERDIVGLHEVSEAHVVEVRGYKDKLACGGNDTKSAEILIQATR